MSNIVPTVEFMLSWDSDEESEGCGEGGGPGVGGELGTDQLSNSIFSSPGANIV